VIPPHFWCFSGVGCPAVLVPTPGGVVSVPDYTYVSTKYEVYYP
jgi:hypothetical protein